MTMISNTNPIVEPTPKDETSDERTLDEEAEDDLLVVGSLHDGYPISHDGETQRPSEAVNHPSHYGGEDNPYETIKVIEAWDLGFCLGNAVKYISRAGKKGPGAEDLLKARWYLDRAIERLG